MLLSLAWRIRRHDGFRNVILHLHTKYSKLNFCVFLQGNALHLERTPPWSQHQRLPFSFLPGARFTFVYFCLKSEKITQNLWKYVSTHGFSSMYNENTPRGAQFRGLLLFLHCNGGNDDDDDVKDDENVD